MSIAELIAKITKGETLTDEEKTFLAAYKEPDMKDRIPKSRLDQEIAKRSEYEQQLADLQKQLEKLSKERDEAVSAKTELEFKNQVSALAGKHNFIDPEYLGFLVRKNQLDLGNEDAVNGFVAGLQKDAPKFFKVETASGAGTQTTGAGDQIKAAYDAAKAQGDINAMIANAPRLDPAGKQ